MKENETMLKKQFIIVKMLVITILMLITSMSGIVFETKISLKMEI